MKNPDEAWFRFNVKTQEWEWSFDPPYKRHELKFTRLVSVDNAAARIESLMAVPMVSADFKEGVRRALVILRAAEYGTSVDAALEAPTLNTPQHAHKADMATLRMALRKMHRRACGDESAVYMSIPADRERDADLLLEDALDELANYRALEAPTLNAPQPAPVTADAGPEVWPALLAEVALSPELRALCEERDAMGRAKYGTALRVNNGREPLADALQESLDLAVYLQQAWMRSKDARLWRLRNRALDIAQDLLDEVKP